MRKKIVLAAACAAAAALLPVQPASAYCAVDLSSVGGPSCYNPCGTVVGTYERADQAAKDALPEHGLDCLL